MTIRIFRTMVAVDPGTGSLIKGGEGLIYAITDTALTTPLLTTDLSANHLPTVSTGPTGLTAEFMVDVPDGGITVKWASGQYVMTISSLDGLMEQVNAVNVAAQEAADAAAAAQAAAEQAAAGGGGGGVSAHGLLAGLTQGDDHPQYLNQTRGDARYYTKSTIDAAILASSTANSAGDRDRTNHTGQQAQSTIGGLEARLSQIEADVDNASSLPDQTDHGGKVLLTDGSEATWQALPPTPPSVATIIYAAQTDPRPTGADIVFWIPGAADLGEPDNAAAGDIVLRSQPVEPMLLALGDETSALTAGVGKLTVRAPYDFTIAEVRGSLTTASGSGPVTVDINVDGASILSTPLTVDAGEKTSVTAAAQPVVVADTVITDDAEITFDVDTAGTGAAGLKITLLIVRSYDPPAAPPPDTPDVVAQTASANTSTNAPAFTLTGYTPVEGDVVIAWTSTTSGGSFDALPAGWVNALGGTTIATPADGTGALICLAHVVTAADVLANTNSWTLTGIWSTAEIGETIAVVVRGADAADPIDAAAAAFDAAPVSPHVLAGLPGASLSNASLVLSCVVPDAMETYTAPAGWVSAAATTGTNQGGNVFVSGTGTAAGVDVAPTNVTPSSADEYMSITVAIKAAP